MLCTVYHHLYSICIIVQYVSVVIIPYYTKPYCYSYSMYCTRTNYHRLLSYHICSIHCVLPFYSTILRRKMTSLTTKVTNLAYPFLIDAVQLCTPHLSFIRLLPRLVPPSLLSLPLQLSLLYSPYSTPPTLLPCASYPFRERRSLNTIAKSQKVSTFVQTIQYVQCAVECM